MSRVFATILTMAVIIGGGHLIRASLHRDGRPAQTSAASRTPFERCMARAKKGFGSGTLPESIRQQFAMDCEAQAGR